MRAAQAAAAGPDTRLGRPFRLLVVCTGNVCRSPLAERLARTRLAELGVDDRGVQVLSAGTDAAVGRPMHPDSAAALVSLGGDPAGPPARQLSAALLRGADLVVTMSRRQRTQVLSLDPRAMSRTFTLVEAADLVASLTGPAGRGGEVELVRSMAQARAGRVGGPGDDIADPIGKQRPEHDRMGQAVRDALFPVLQHLVDSSTPP